MATTDPKGGAMTRVQFFDEHRALYPDRRIPGDHIPVLDGIADKLGLARIATAAPVANLTVSIVLEVAHHEAIVQEAYKDGGGVWTWAMGITNASGHEVYPRYKDSPQPMRRCVEVSVWLLQTKYLVEVLRAFGGHSLTEAQLAAALSFHWNTGAIGVTDWVKAVKGGAPATARAFWESHYLNGGDLTARRKAETALFFDGVWANDGKTTVYEVSKPSYAPKWSSARRIDISADVAAVLGGAA